MTYIKQFIAGLLASFAVFALVIAPASLPALAQVNIPDLCESGSGGSNCVDFVENENLDDGADGIVNIILLVAQGFSFVIVAISAFFLVYGGFLFVTDNGDSKRAGQGKTIIFNALIGLIISILAISIVSVVAGLVSTI